MASRLLLSEDTVGAFKHYYRVLGIDSTADGVAIKAAFRRLALRCHPDRAKTARAARRFQEIREAYDVLSDPDRRREFDRVYRVQTALRPVARRERRTAAAPARASSAGLGITVDLLGLRLGVTVNTRSMPAAPSTLRSRSRRKKR
jgi:curved DNA-binding protein CbpA